MSERKMIAAEYRPSDNPLIARRDMARSAAREQYPNNCEWRERAAFVRSALRRLDGQPEQRTLSPALAVAADLGDSWACELLLTAQDDFALLDRIMPRIESIFRTRDETRTVARDCDGFGRQFTVVHVVENDEVER